MADGDKIYADVDGLHAASTTIIQLGDSADQAVGDGSGIKGSVINTFLGGNLSGFATNGPLSRIPSATAAAGHTLAGRFYVLGELVSTAADRYSGTDIAAARAIDTAGDLNEPSKGR